MGVYPVVEAPAMKKQQAEEKPDLIIKPHHDRILEAVYQYHFLTADRVVRLLYSPTSLTTVRATLARLAEAKYLLPFHEPRATPVGATPKIYTLSLRGYNRLKQQGYHMPPRFREPDIEDLQKNYLFLRHNLAVTDFLIAAAMLERSFPTFRVYDFLHERTIKQQKKLIAVTVEKPTAKTAQGADQNGAASMQTIRFLPDGFLDIRVTNSEDGKTKRCCILLEVDRKTEGEDDIRRKVRGYLTFVKSGACLKEFGTKLPTVAFVNTVGGEKKRDQLIQWAEAELKKTKEPHFWTEMFVFASISEDQPMNSEAIFLSPVWYTPFSSKPTVLLSFGSR